ncbi:hypothetical protein [Facklamia miroungae]|uniref:Uncharacterized protein n=1 Tax=Facklamia miroungae TaxID=120956 RepID=A0A1G7TBP7_9LACT|nr:hypothetical protein [Facklamia miroungae]NKZ29751.1 hypothetical protein [Facklamia miroungae]SDG32621.1 hypothetical protein SAMN05421791_10580 [Facklamia miroungae]
MENLKLFKIYSNFEEYIDSFNNIRLNFTEKVPIFVDEERKDLLDSIKRFSNEDFERIPIFKCEAGIILSEELEFYKNSDLFCIQWLYTVGEKKFLNNLVLIGLYKDFSQDKALKILEYCKQNNIEVYLLTGRDLSSLSWMIGKQFFTLKNSELRKAIFSHKKMNEFKEKDFDWEFFDIRRLEREDIKGVLTKKHWSELVFHGHGKEDHLNLADFTLHGFNKALPQKEKFAPSWGHVGQSFFKDEKKAIRISSINVEKIFLLSCSNFPFYDSRLYDSRFNLTLDAIDGMSRNVVASIGVQSIDNPELYEILVESDSTNIGRKLHNKLEDVQPFVSIINIGIPNNSKIFKAAEKYNKTARLTKISGMVLSRLSVFASSGLLSGDHSIRKLSNNILSDYMQMTRRGTYGTTEKKYLDFEQNLINRVNPISKKMAEMMIQNQSDELFEFDRYNIFRSIVDKNSIVSKKCCCGSSGVECCYIPETENLFTIKTFYCYRCGDKSTSMIGMPEVEFTCDNYDQERLKIKYKIVITPQNKGDVYLGIQLPTYVENSSNLSAELKRIRFKTISTKVIEGEVSFEEDTLLQSYYLKLFIVQNGGIAISRCFFNLVNDCEEK